MKNIVVSDEYNEFDLKPSGLIEQYVKMIKKEIFNFFIKNKLIDCFCPLCVSRSYKDIFDKFGLKYRECGHCKTLYVSPRPDDTAIKEFYLKSNSRKFWQERLFKATDKKRKEKILKPRFEWIADSTKEFLPEARHWVDFNTNQYGYIEEMANQQFISRKTLLNPFLEEERLRTYENIYVLADYDWPEKLKNQVDIISLFEAIDRTSDIGSLFESIKYILKPNGLIFITSILSTGFDVKELWDKAENIYPPDRLNLSSIEGLKTLFKRFNFECIEFSTPGILDLEIVSNAINNNSEIHISRFARALAESKDENLRDAFQKFLQANRLSSYGRILLRKRS